jgi:hypothetical protein
MKNLRNIVSSVVLSAAVLGASLTCADAGVVASAAAPHTQSLLGKIGVGVHVKHHKHGGGVHIGLKL